MIIISDKSEFQPKILNVMKNTFNAERHIHFEDIKFMTIHAPNKIATTIIKQKLQET